MRLYRRQAPPIDRWGGLVLLATGAELTVPAVVASGSGPSSLTDGVASEHPVRSVADVIALATTQVDRRPAVIRAARAARAAVAAGAGGLSR